MTSQGTRGELTRIDSIQQRKMDALAAKYLHEQRLAHLNRLTLVVDFLAVAVPILYFPARYTTKGTTLSTVIEFSFEISAALLLVLTVYKVMSRWQEKADRHNRLVAENISLTGQADYLLNSTNSISQNDINWFLILADNCEKADREALGVVKDRERKHAYREALKEYSPNSTDTTCPKCGASPWDYKPGSCQLCGNTPVN